MLGFMQGFAYGLWLSCLPWLITGLINPGLAVPSDPPRRWKVLVRYALVLPFLAFVLWLTSLWGGFSPTLLGWLVGLGAVAVSLPLERRWHRWRRARAQRREAELLRAAQSERERGARVLNPAHPPADADNVVRALAAAKQNLLDAQRPDLAVQADRLYTRYAHVLDVLRDKFDPREVTFERSRGLIAEVARSALDHLTDMASLASSVRGMDAEFVRRRLAGTDVMAPDERATLQRRLALVDDTERRIDALSGLNEAVLTALDHAAVEVARVRTDRPQAAVAADQALQDLRRFIDKAPLYSRGTL